MTQTTQQIAPVFSKLQPPMVWKHFDTLCRTPRQSKNESALRNQLRQWASNLRLDSEVDSAGNLIIRKPASAGYETAPTAILQAHLDMVCQKNNGTAHDFEHDPIRPVIRDGWLIAENTTLGADNGIGVALILAVLESPALSHGPIEALLTVDEEDGMGGARGLEANRLKGRLMLNLDTEEWGEFYLGCAGGLDVDVERHALAEPIPDGYSGWKLELGGLRGGHSGINIHEGRGNAIKLLVRVLRDLERLVPLRLSSLNGGSARNALPREASATFALPIALEPLLQDQLVSWQNRLQQELRGVDAPKLQLVSSATIGSLMPEHEQAVWLASLHAAPHGVRNMSREIAGVVETSNNLGMVSLTPNAGTCNFMLRSLIEGGSNALAEEIASLFSLSGTTARPSGYYPGWTPNPESPLLALCQSVYRQTYGENAKVQVIHAGLECGLVGTVYPGIDIVSFGPTIRGAHAPGEGVELASVEKAWHLVAAILTSVASAPSST